MPNDSGASVRGGTTQSRKLWNDLRQSNRSVDAVEDTKADLWDRDAAFNELYGSISFADERAAQALFDGIVLYSRGRFDEAYTTVEQLMEHNDPVITLTSRATHLRISLVKGFPESAYEDSLILREMCVKGLTRPGNRRLYGASIICALFLENTIRAVLFDIPPMEAFSEVIPPVLCAYYGYVLATRATMSGNYELARGIAYSYQPLVKSNMYDACCWLYLVNAKSYVALGEVQSAKDAFMKAWHIREQQGIYAPFIESLTEYYGLHRAFIKERQPAEYAKMEALANSYRKTSYDLSMRWGMHTPIFSLSSFECCVWMLVALGWRNKEVASFLRVTENTVKHQLTSVFQKMGVKSRQELRDGERSLDHKS